MTHPAMETLLAHIDRELAHEEANAVAGHIATCATCSLKVAGLRETSGVFAAALGRFDRAEPVEWSAAEPGEPDIVPFPVRGARVQAAGIGRLLPRAAAILLLMGAAASAAIVTTRLVTSDMDIDAITTERADAQAVISSVAVGPADGIVHVTLTGAATGTRVHVSLDDRVDATVSIESVQTPHFTAADGRVDVDLGDVAAIIRVTLPRDVREARVMSGDSVLVSVADGRVVPESATGVGVTTGGAVRTTGQ